MPALGVDRRMQLDVPPPSLDPDFWTLELKVLRQKVLSHRRVVVDLLRLRNVAIGLGVVLDSEGSVEIGIDVHERREGLLVVDGGERVECRVGGEVDFGGGAEEKRGAESNDEDWNGDGEEVLVEICMQFVSSLPCDD